MALMNLTDFTIAPDATLIQAVAKMNANQSRTVLVVTEGKVTGLISEGDVMRALLRGVDTHVRAGEIASPSFRFLTRTDFRQAFAWFQTHAFGMVPVVDEEFRLVDVITLGQVLERVEWVAAE